MIQSKILLLGDYVITILGDYIITFSPASKKTEKFSFQLTPVKKHFLLIFAIFKNLKSMFFLAFKKRSCNRA